MGLSDKTVFYKQFGCCWTFFQSPFSDMNSLKSRFRMTKIHHSIIAMVAAEIETVPGGTEHRGDLSWI